MAIQGDDRPVLAAIPGTMCAPSVYHRLVERLAGRVQVDPVSWMTEPSPWDLGTVAERIATHIADEYGGPVVVAGHSTGGAIALHLATDHPELVAGLLILDSGAHMRGHGDVDRILATIETNWGPELREGVLTGSFSAPLDPADREELIEYAAAVPQQAVLEALRSQRALDLTPRLAALTCPATVVHGTLDPRRTPAEARELADSIPGARLRLLETGHTPMYEDPDSVAAELFALLARIDSLRN